MENNNLFSIGEIAKAIGITRKIILNYETKGLIAPDKKDGTTGNRYYSIDTFTELIWKQRHLATQSKIFMSTFAQYKYYGSS